jgi:hypothetical protein
MEMGRERGIVEAGFPIRSGMTIGNSMDHRETLRVLR